MDESIQLMSTDSLSGNSKNNGAEKDDLERSGVRQRVGQAGFDVPDGGLKAWLTLGGSYVCVAFSPVRCLMSRLVLVSAHLLSSRHWDMSHRMEYIRVCQVSCVCFCSQTECFAQIITLEST